MGIQPYLFFEGRCDEALAFYRDALGARVTALMRMSESPEPPPPGMLPAGSESKVMHAEFTIDTATVMASDGMCSGQPRFEGVSLSLACPDVATAERRFAALAAGGAVRMPFGRTFWSEGFGMVADRFGVPWMVTVARAAG